MAQVREELHLQTAAGVRQALQAHVAGRSDCVRGGRRLHPGDCGGARLDRLPRRRVPRALPPLPSCPTHSATSHPFWMVEQAAPRGRGGCRTHTCRSAKSFSVSVSACIHPAAPASPGDQGDTHATRTSEGRLQATKKAASLPAFSLIDAGGGVLVDLDGDGNEIYSERKVYTSSAATRLSAVPGLKGEPR